MNKDLVIANDQITGVSIPGQSEHGPTEMDLIPEDSFKDVRCPKCNKLITRVIGNVIIQFKCKRCKFEGKINIL